MKRRMMGKKKIIYTVTSNQIVGNNTPITVSVDGVLVATSSTFPITWSSVPYDKNVVVTLGNIKVPDSVVSNFTSDNLDCRWGYWTVYRLHCFPNSSIEIGGNGSFVSDWVSCYLMKNAKFQTTTIYSLNTTATLMKGSTSVAINAIPASTTVLLDSGKEHELRWGKVLDHSDFVLDEYNDGYIQEVTVDRSDSFTFHDGAGKIIATDEYNRTYTLHVNEDW